jgi:hypothetical protein
MLMIGVVIVIVIVILMLMLIVIIIVILRRTVKSDIQWIIIKINI